MGKYINQTSAGLIGPTANQKCTALINDGAVEIEQPEQWEQNLVCVVDNGMFAAAGFCFDEREFRVFTSPGDYRPKRWFIWEPVEQYAV